MTTDVEVAIAAAEAGVVVVRESYGSALTKHAKSPTDFATNADIEAERAILDVITAAPLMMLSRARNPAEVARRSRRAGGSLTRYAALSTSLPRHPWLR